MKAMKNLSLFLFACLLMGCGHTDDPDEITPIDPIADEAFMTFLLEHFDQNKDGLLSVEEASGVKEISCAGYSQISSLSGLENFPALETLDCSGTSITTLDFSHNKHLKKLICQSTLIATLDISQSTIEELDCSYSLALKSLNAKGSQSLKKLICRNTNLVTLDASESTIETFDFYAGSWDTAIFLNDCLRLKEIEHLYVNPKYQYVQYFEGNLTFNVDGCTSLTRFRSNLVGQLHINGCSALKELECIGTFRSLDCPNPELERITLHSPRLEEMDVSSCSELKALSFCAIIDQLDLSENNRLEHLTCISALLPALDVSSLPNLKTLEYGFYKTNTTLDLRQNTALEELVVRDTLIDDYSMNNRNLNIQLQDLSSLKKLYVSSRYVREINASGCNNLQEVEFENFSYYLSALSVLNLDGCDALQSFSCTSSSLQSLDLSHCLQLDSLTIKKGLLRSLKTNKQLKVLDCSENELTALDLSNSPGLLRLDCSFNQINDLKINDCPKLTILNCSTNRLPALDLEGCPAFETLNCFANEITALALAECPALDKLYCEMNLLTELDVSQNRQLTELACVDNPHLTSLYLYRNHILSHLSKDNHTTIILKD